MGFRLRSGPRSLFDYPPVASFADRFFQVYGDRPGLVEVRKEAAGIRLSGLAAALAADGPSRGPQHLFVNRRAVKDRTILHAVNHAYGRATIKPRSPEVHLFLELPHERVDVNVHPTKAEVRFLSSNRWCTRWCGAVWPTRWGRRRFRRCRSLHHGGGGTSRGRPRFRASSPEWARRAAGGR